MGPCGAHHASVSIVTSQRTQWYLLHGPELYASLDPSGKSPIVIHLRVVPFRSLAWAHLELTMLLQIHKHPDVQLVPLAWAHVELSMQIPVVRDEAAKRCSRVEASQIARFFPGR